MAAPPRVVAQLLSSGAEEPRLVASVGSRAEPAVSDTASGAVFPVDALITPEHGSVCMRLDPLQPYSLPLEN